MNAVEDTSKTGAAHWPSAETEVPFSRHPVPAPCPCPAGSPDREPLPPVPGWAQHTPALGLEHCSTAASETLVLFPILTPSRFFHYTPLLKASCFACSCLYSQAVSGLDVGISQSLPSPSSGLPTAEILRSAPRWGYCPQIAALGSQIPFSQREKIKWSTDYLLISGPFMNPLILLTYFSGQGWHMLGSH